MILPGITQGFFLNIGSFDGRVANLIFESFFCGVVGSLGVPPLGVAEAGLFESGGGVDDRW